MTEDRKKVRLYASQLREAGDRDALKAFRVKRKELKEAGTREEMLAGLVLEYNL